MYRATLHCSGAVFLMKYFNSVKIFPDFLVLDIIFSSTLRHLTGGWEAGWFCVKAKKSGEQSGLAGNTEGRGGGTRGGESMKPPGSQENSQATVVGNGGWVGTEKEDIYLYLTFVGFLFLTKYLSGTCRRYKGGEICYIPHSVTEVTWYTDMDIIHL